MKITEIAAAAKSASILLAASKTEAKDCALAQIARVLSDDSAKIVAANTEELAAAQKSHLAAPLLKRLKFDKAKIGQVVAGIESLIALEDPVGRALAATELDTG